MSPTAELASMVLKGALRQLLIVECLHGPDVEKMGKWQERSNTDDFNTRRGLS